MNTTNDSMDEFDYNKVSAVHRAYFLSRVQSLSRVLRARLEFK